MTKVIIAATNNIARRGKETVNSRGTVDCFVRSAVLERDKTVKNPSSDSRV